MPKFDENQIDYSEFSYKNYLFKNGKFVKSPKTNTKYSKKQTKKRALDRQGAFVATAIMLCFAITILMANFVSGGNFLSLVAQKDVLIYENKSEYFALAIDFYSDESIAHITADELRQMGGGGYIVFDKGYYLIASVYGNSDDAEAVKKRLNSQNASIYKLKMDEPKLYWCTKAEKSNVQNTLKYAEIVYNELYAISVSIDKGEMLEYDARVAIKALIDKVDNIKTEFENNIVKATLKSNKIRTELSVIIAMLDNLLNNKLPRYNLVSDVRFTYTAVLVGYKNLLDNI